MMAEPTGASRPTMAEPSAPTRPDLSAPGSEEALVSAARHAQAHAYAPYSGFRVGAAVRTASGQVYSGGNVENASYGLAICAERAAMFAAVGAEGPACELVAVAVFADADECAPCGACRQVLAEFGAGATATFMAGGRYVTVGLGNLLPYQFKLGLGLR